jgi:hypothetical protein
VNEGSFEGAIEAWLLEHGGYALGDPRTFDRQLGLDPGELLAFVAETQPDAWRELTRGTAARRPRARTSSGGSPPRSTSAGPSTSSATASGPRHRDPARVLSSRRTGSRPSSSRNQVPEHAIAQYRRDREPRTSRSRGARL